ncbi:uncharacterized protein V1518DRAFT_406190 [Limtongia smithiae]|uniref:uncharacterized protein n=1 Tax=Limtongia smithiae TaxID=1125753 RepID=UPI0034CD89E9
MSADLALSSDTRTPLVRAAASSPTTPTTTATTVSSTSNYSPVSALGSGSTTPISAFAPGDNNDDNDNDNNNDNDNDNNEDYSDLPDTPGEIRSVAADGTVSGSSSSYFPPQFQPPSRPESRSSTLSGLSTTAVKDGIEGRRVHQHHSEMKNPAVYAKQHHHHRPHGSTIPISSTGDVQDARPSGSSRPVSVSSIASTASDDSATTPLRQDLESYLPVAST